MELYSNRWRINVYYRLLVIYVILIFFFWGVKKCVFLNFFEGYSFLVNLFDLVCFLNVKESILFYFV